MTAVPGSSEEAAPPLDVTVEEATSVTDELRAAVARLIPQLSRSAAVPDDRELAEIVASPASILLVARDGQGTIVGSLTLDVLDPGPHTGRDAEDDES